MPQTTILETRQVLPEKSYSIQVPPIKCQGIKTKIVEKIKQKVSWEENGRWIEPFMGSGVVLFNVNPARAIASDTNRHIINFYECLKSGKITARDVKEHLTDNGKKLLEKGETHYYSIRDNFNESPNALDFLFLNRSSFNGVMRFNSKGKFNVPFCRKPDRFRQAYVTKITNQVENLIENMENKNWEFKCIDWKDALKGLKSTDFVYLDPPYEARHNDYFGKWTKEDTEELARISKNLPCRFILSMWSENKYRKNESLYEKWGEFEMVKVKHFYHVGATEDLRNEMEEALVLGNF